MLRRRALRAAGYRFITVTPETHRRVNARRSSQEARSLRDVFGWSRPFTARLLPATLLALVEGARMVEKQPSTSTTPGPPRTRRPSSSVRTPTALDVKHSEAWNRELLRTLVEADPRVARPIAEGALMRLDAGARCFERYRRELGLVLPRA
ncbi:MAG TPA: hypothetical protein VF794_10230 [Archangium sp.]|jgi:hypothetical protein|uniref:hypothetical protein n=1 Tax=Archangium sp. TaxID=1872627 RepID=UPI002EDA04CF